MEGKPRKWWVQSPSEDDVTMPLYFLSTRFCATLQRPGSLLHILPVYDTIWLNSFCFCRNQFLKYDKDLLFWFVLFFFFLFFFFFLSSSGQCRSHVTWGCPAEHVLLRLAGEISLLLCLHKYMLLCIAGIGRSIRRIKRRCLFCYLVICLFRCFGECSMIPSR